MKYQAFISYSHAADSLVAPALQSALHKFARPFYRLRAIRTFRDKSSAPLTHKFWPFIQDAIQDSEFFILLASIQASSSPWVNAEVEEWFKSEKGPENFLIVLTEGIIKWDKTNNDFDWENSTALPLALHDKFNGEPLWLDLSWVEKSTETSLRDARFLDGIATLAAAIHKKPKDLMVGEDVRQHRKFKHTVRITVSLLAALVVASVYFGLDANSQRTVAELQTQEAQKQREVAERQTKLATESAEKERAERERADNEAKEAKRQEQIADEKAIEAAEQRDIAVEQRALAEDRSRLAQSRALAAEARQPESSEIDGALIKSAHAFKESPTVEARAALLDVFSKSPKLVRYFRCGEGLFAASVSFSEDGKLLAYSCTGPDSATLSVVNTVDQTTNRNIPLKGDSRHLLFATSNLVAIGSQRDLRLVDITDGRVVSFPGHSAEISALVIVPEQGALFSGDYKGEIRIWKTNELKQGRATSSLLKLDEHLGNLSNAVDKIEYSSASRSLSVTFSDGSERVIDESAWNNQQVKQSGLVRSVRPSAITDSRVKSPCLDQYPKIIRSKALEVGSLDRKWHAYVIDSNQIIVSNKGKCLPLSGHGNNVSDLAFGNRQSNLLASAGVIGTSGHAVLLWDLDQYHPLVTQLDGTPPSRFSRTKLALSANGESWACMGCAKSILWDGTPLPLMGYDSLHDIKSLAISESRKNLAIGLGDGQILIATRQVDGKIDIADGPKLGTSAESLIFTTMGELYAVGRDGQSVRWYKNSPSWKDLKNFPKDPECLMLQGKRPSLAVGTYNSQLKPAVWFFDLRTGSGISVELPPSASAQGGGGCSGIGYTPSARLAARTSLGYRPIYLVSSSPKPYAIEILNPLRLTENSLPTILENTQLSRDGKVLVTSSQNQAIAVFDVPAKRLIGTIELPGLMSLVLSEDGKRLFTLSEAGLLRWNLDTSTWAQKALQLANVESQ